MPTRFRLAAAIVSALLFLLTMAAYAQQTPIALPYTMTTIGGLTPMAATAGTQCPGLPAGVTSSDAYGDGCLAVSGIFGVSAFSGVVVDAFGNVLVNDDIKGVLHQINPNSGMMTLVAGGNTACGSKQDATGDGCVAATGTPTTLISDARGVGIDPYGNVLLAGYNDHFVHLICRNASPLCGSGTPSAANPILIPIGNVGLVAGCAYATGSTGVTGAGTDGTPGFSTATALFSGSPFVNAGGSSSACTAALGEVDQPRGVTADAFGNVYYADTTSERWRVVLGPQSYNGVTNPLWALLEQNPAWSTVTAGYVYTIAGLTTTATTKGSSTHCNGNASFPTPDATDAVGDGCLFTSASVFASSSDAQGVAVDAAGNVIFTDAGHGLLRVLFVSGAGPAGASMVNVIEGNNVGMTPATPQPGFVYALAGSGSTGISGTPTLGSATSALDSSTTKVTVSSQGNIFIGDKTRVLFFDISTGYIRTLFTQAAANVAAGSFCTGSSGPVSLSAYSDGCAASVSEFGNSNGLSVAVDGQGNLYLYDGTSSASGQLVRKVLAQGFAPQSLATAREQIFEAHLLNASAAASTATLTATPDMSAGSPSCTLHADASVDCTVTVTSTPSAAGERSATVSVANASSATEANIGLGGAVSGTVLAFDNASTTVNSVTTPVAPTANAVFSSITPAGVAVDGAGNVYTANGASILESAGANIYTLTSSLPSMPSQIAVDPLGDVFAVANGTATIEELAISAAGAPASYTLTAISYTSCASCTAAPQAVAVDQEGNLFVADYQSGGSTIYRLSLAGNMARQQITVAAGLSNPVSLAVDAAGNVYAADKGAGKVYEYSPGATGSYALNATRGTLLSGVTPVALATDAAGDVYVQDESSSTVIEVPVSGAETTVLSGLQNPDGIAVDGLGNVYSADAHNTSITQVVRDAGSYGSTSSNLSSIAGTLTNVGNLAAAGITQTGSAADFTLTPSGCTIGTNNSFAAGLACTVSAALSPAALANSGVAYTDALSFLAAPAAIGSVSFSDLVPAGPTATSISGPGSALYAASGTEATFTVSVTGIASPSGSAIAVTVNSVTNAGSAVVYTSTPTLNGSGQATVSLSGLAAGNYMISASYAGITNTYSPSSAQTSFAIEQFVATGDSRTVTEPAFPAVCTTLAAALTSVNNDIPASVDATVTNPDGARIQAALNSCAGTGQAVELSMDGAGHDAYLTGPLTMPSNVTLLVDPGVYVYFSRNVQDYDTTPGTHTCGTVNSASATASCLPLIDINNATNVGIMGFGKLDGRGGDPLLNAFPATYAGQSWWGLSSIANSGGTQQNPRFVQIDAGSSNVTLYKITLRNSPLFHISTTGSASNFTAWDIKIVTPTSSRNTDGIDPGNAQNFTITRSWISDGDDNIAVGAAGTTAPAANISVTNNHFFAGHGESIGSYTSAGVSNVLFDGNMSSGNGVAGSGSSINNTADSNSTGIRIKSGYDRGGLVTNIQYSNSCYQNHKAEIVFSPNYEATTGTESPNFTNILMQNLTFLTEGTAQFTGTNNNGTIYPLQVALDNVSFPGTYPVAEFSTAPTNAALSYGPGEVSTDFINDFATFAGANGNTAANNITETSLVPPTCSFTYIAPELTGPNGLPQTITEGQNATAVVILTPAVGGAAYPTGTVTLTDALTSNTTTVALPGTTDTIFIPLTGLTPGTHSFTATYSGDSNYTLTSGQSVYSTTAPYLITVNAGSLGSTTTTLSGVPSSTPFGTSFTATATVAGSSPTGNVQFIVNGSVFATAVLTSGTATAAISLPYSTSAYSIYAVYSGDAANDGSTSSAASVTVTAALTTTALSASTTTATLGHPVALTAYVTSVVGAPTGTVTFTYTTTGSSTPQPTTAILSNGIATAGVLLPVGTDSVTATYAASGSYAGSASAPMSFTVTVGTILGLPTNPIALPYTMTTLAGGAASNCAGATDSFGDGCQGTSMVFGGSVDLRSVVADPFGNVYLTDAVANLVRRIAPNGVISNFAGRVSGTACVPSATTGCTPTQVSMDKPRGVSSDALGNIYIAGYDSHEIFKVSVANGLLYLVAGTGTAGSIGDGGAATAAEVNAPRGVWADTVGNVYIADTSNNKIRVVDITGNIHTFAGTGTAASNGDGGLATLAAIDNPQGVMTDANLNVYIADAAKVRVVCVTCGTGSPLDALLATLGISAPQNGYIYTIAGGAASSYAGAYPTLATNVTLSPQKLAIDGSSNVYISDGNGVAWFVDSRTASIRPIAGKTATNCAGETDNYGDGCPATQAVIGDGGNGIGVGTDALGNLYISDTLNARIRKVTTDLASPPTATGNTKSQSVELHFIAGDTLATSNALVYSSSEWSVGAPNCTANADTTTDCLLSASFTPAVGGGRSTPLTVNSSLGNIANLALTGVGLGAGSTLDPASQISFGTNLQVIGLATDMAGNVYVSDAKSKQLLRFAPAALGQGASAPSTSLVTLGAPGAVAVDARGYVYVADTSTGLITQISPSGATSTLPLTLTAPAGLAVDALNNLYVSDSSAQAVYQLNPITGASRTLATGALVAPAGLAIDPAGNLLIADPGAGAIYRFNLQSGATTAVSSAAVKPSAIATDAAGNLLIADTASILAVPASANSAAFTVASLAPSALAIDSAGNLYTGSGGSVLKLIRTQGTVQFAGASALPQTVNLLESGNQALQLASISQTDSADYSLTATPSTDCVLNGSLPSTLAVGGACTLTAAYTPTTFVPTTDTATLNGNLANAALSTPSAVQLVLTGPAVAPASAIALNPFSPAAPVYGQSITVSATVSGPSILPAGTVVFTVDGSTTSASVIAGVATATLTGLSVGPHTVSAAYTSSNGFAPSATSQETLTVTQASQTIIWAGPAAQIAATTLALTATASSGLPVSYISFTPAICTISTDGSGNPIALMLAYGNCSLQAEQAGNIDYSAAPAVGYTFFVHHAAQTITWSDPPAQIAATTLALTATASSGLPVSYISFTPAICTISTDGSGNPIALMLAYGNCSLQAQQAGNTAYSAAPAVGWTFFVHHASQTISFPLIAYDQTAATTVTLSATASSGLTVTFSSLTPSICTVSGSTVALLSYGSCTVNADQAGNGEYSAAATASQTFFVHHASQTITFPLIPYNQTAATTVTLSATASSGLTVTFSSLTPSICTVSGSTVTLLGYGSCTVDADQAGNGEYSAAATASQTFFVHHASQTITFPAVGTQTAGSSVLLPATASSGLAVSYASTTPAVCTIDGTGLNAVLAAPGTCTIQASQAGNAAYSAATTVTQSFTVIAPPVS